MLRPKCSFWYDLTDLLPVDPVTSKDILIWVYTFQINSTKSVLRIKEFEAELAFPVINSTLDEIMQLISYTFSPEHSLNKIMKDCFSKFLISSSFSNALLYNSVNIYCVVCYWGKSYDYLFSLKGLTHKLFGL